METFILIHGAWHGGWCWEKVIPYIKKAGHKVIAPDLPGHGENRKKAIEEISLGDYVNCLSKILDEQTKPVILVGHSMGGIVISQVAEYKPDKIKKLVYLSAYLLTDGESMVPKDTRITNHLATKDEDLRELFYNDCSEADFRWARTRLTPQPKEPLTTPIHVTAENFVGIPRIYITLLNDHSILPSEQEEMYTQIPCQSVIFMNTSHSPFLSAPVELAENLLSLTN